RETSQVALLPIPQIAEDPEAFQLVDVSGVSVGSVSLAPASSVALLYTNAVASPYLSTLNTAVEPFTARTIVLHAPVQAVLPTPDASYAVVLHPAADLGESGSGA